ncbi:MAG: ribonuclease III domain-containing protein [Anaerovoracaceae bacterium]
MIKSLNQINTTALAYMGDAVYEVYVRKHVMESGQVNADKLHFMAVPYVKAKGQAEAVRALLDGFLSEKEASPYAPETEGRHQSLKTLTP